MFYNWDMANENLHRRFIEICDAEFDRRIDDIAKYILSAHNLKICAVAGPSSSGKTTTALKLRRKISSSGKICHTVSMDNFFKNRDDVPLKDDGSHDFECIGAVDTPLLFQCLEEAITKGSTNIPHFSFKRGGRQPETTPLSVKAGDLIIIEGIHGLNPLITEKLERFGFKSIYISVDEKVYLPSGELFKKRDVRFIRRLVRDFNFRGASPEYTFKLWENVRLGEDNYIFPLEKFADIIINSLHGYELCVMKNKALELLGTIDLSGKYGERTAELIGKLGQIIPIDEKLVPSTSLIREFIGGSEYYE